MKMVEDYVEKCSITLKGVKGQLRPFLGQWAQTSEEGTPNFEYFLDGIAKFYRDNYNSKDRVDFELNDFATGTRMHLMCGGEYESSMPTQDQFRLFASSENESHPDFLVKIDNEGLSITHISDDVDVGKAQFSGPIYQQANDIYKLMWDDDRKFNNGAEKLWQDMKAGNISNDECNQGLRKVIKKTQQGEMGAGTKYLTNQWKKNGVALDIGHLDIAKAK